MPLSRRRRFFRRPFSSSKRRRFTSSSSSTSLSSSSRSHALRTPRVPVSLLTYKGSLSSHQVMPDRYRTWVTTNLVGYFPTGVSGHTFGFGLDSIVTPFNDLAGATLTALVNPGVAVANLSPGGVKNLLYNATYGTGIYNEYRVWRAKVSISVTPQNGVDNGVLVAAPLTNPSAGVFSNNVSGVCLMSQTPNARRVVCSAGIAEKDCTVTLDLSIPALLGFSNSAYASLQHPYTYGGGVWLQGLFTAQDTTNFNNYQPYSVTLMQFVEFVSRTDYGLAE